MKRPLQPLANLLLTVGVCSFVSARAQVVPVASIAGVTDTSYTQEIANQYAMANKIVAYRGRTFLMKRTPSNVLTGLATDRIAQLEIQLAFCYKVLLTDTLNPTCPPERQAFIRAAFKYLDVARPKWDQKAYREEFRFYLTEDKRRRRANDY